MKKIIAVITIIAISGLVWRFFFHNTSSTAIVKVASVKRGEIASIVTGTETGTIKGDKEIKVGAQVSGLVEKVFVAEGDYVRAGEKIALIDRTSLLLQEKQAKGILMAAEARLEELQAAAQLQPKQTKSHIDQAEAALKAAKAKLSLLKRGARPEEITQAETTVEQAQVNLEEAKKNLERLRGLFEAGVMAKREVEQAETRCKVAEAQYKAALQTLELVKTRVTPEELQAAEAEVERAQAGLSATIAGAIQDEIRRKEVAAARAQVYQGRARLAELHRQLEHTVIKAPISGIISEIYVKEGELLTAGLSTGIRPDMLVRRAPESIMLVPDVLSEADLGLTVAKIIDISKLWIEVTIDEADLGKVKIGQPVNFTTDAFPGEIFRGRVEKISPVASGPKRESRSFSVKVRIFGSSGLLRPGMSADVEIVTGSKSGVLVAPTQAVIEREGKKMVYLVENGRAKLREVEIGLSNWDWSEIKSGLKIGDRVITTPDAKNLKDGVKVQID